MHKSQLFALCQVEKCLTLLIVMIFRGLKSKVTNLWICRSAHGKTLAASSFALVLAPTGALQEARYLHGLDITAMPVLDQLLREMGLAPAADRLTQASPELRQASDARTQRAQMLMQAHGAQGVPALVLTNEHGSRLLSANALYGDFDTLLGHIAGG